MGVNTLTAEWTASLRTHWHHHSSPLYCGLLAPAMSCPREASPPTRSAVMPWGRTFMRTSCESWRWAGWTWRTRRPRRKQKTPVGSPSAPWSSWICCMRKSREWCARQGGCSSNPWWPCRRRKSWSWSHDGSGSSTGSHSKVKPPCWSFNLAAAVLFVICQEHFMYAAFSQWVKGDQKITPNFTRSTHHLKWSMCLSSPLKWGAAQCLWTSACTALCFIPQWELFCLTS